MDLGGVPMKECSPFPKAPEVQSVYSTAPADWATQQLETIIENAIGDWESCLRFIYHYIPLERHGMCCVLVSEHK